MTSESADQDLGLPLGAVALDMVRKSEDGPEKYIIHPKGPEVIRAGVQAVLLSGEPAAQMADRFRQVIALCHVLSEKQGCPDAARVVADALFSDERVGQILNAQRNEADQRNVEYRKFLNEEGLRRAPQIDADAPDDAVKLHAFINPGQQRPAKRPAAARPGDDPNFKVQPGPRRRGAPQKKAEETSADADKPARRGVPPRHGRKA